MKPLNVNALKLCGEVRKKAGKVLCFSIPTYTLRRVGERLRQRRRMLGPNQINVHRMLCHQLCNFQSLIKEVVV